MSNQLVLWEGQPVPPSRARALVKVEKQHGIEQATVRSQVYSAGAEMRSIIVDKTAGEAGRVIMSRLRQINRAVNIEGVNKCHPSKWPLVKIGCDLVTAAYRKCIDKASRKTKIAGDMEWLNLFVVELERRVA